MENNQPDQQQQPLSVDKQPLPQAVIPYQGKSKKSVIIAAIVVFILLIIITTAVVLYRKEGKSNSIPIPTPSTAVGIPVKTPIPTVPTDTSIRLNLEKEKVVKIPTTDITIEYIGASLPNPKCFDCISTTDIALIKNSIRKILSYSCGGIAGKCTDKITEYDMEVTLENSTDTAAQVKIKKQ